MDVRYTRNTEGDVYIHERNLIIEWLSSSGSVGGGNRKEIFDDLPVSLTWGRCVGCITNAPKDTSTGYALKDDYTQTKTTIYNGASSTYSYQYRIIVIGWI